jgi:hypothetical protein
MSNKAEPRTAAEIMETRLPAVRFIEDLKRGSTPNIAYDNLICACIWFCDALEDEGLTEASVEEFIVTLSNSVREAGADVVKGREHLAQIAALAAAPPAGNS